MRLAAWTETRGDGQKLASDGQKRESLRSPVFMGPGRNGQNGQANSGVDCIACVGPAPIPLFLSLIFK